MRWSSRRKTAAESAAYRLHDAVVARARTPVFHTQFAVPDSVDGRFDLLLLHLYLLLDRLRADPGDETKAVAASLADIAFAALEEALRELGVGDMGMSRRVRAMTEAYQGRLAAYAAAGDDVAVLKAAILRNLYRGDDDHGAEAEALAHYVLSERQWLAGFDTRRLVAGEADFGPLPSFRGLRS